MRVKLYPTKTACAPWKWIIHAVAMVTYILILVTLLVMGLLQYGPQQYDQTVNNKIKLYE